MKPLQDYFYRFPSAQLRMSGRCRVRIYKRNNGSHTVLLTELNTNAGESITSVCDRIATDLVAGKGLNPKTTRWIQHEPPHDGLPQTFDELHFTWDKQTATNPQWQSLGAEQAEALTGDNLSSLNRQLGDVGFQVEEENENEHESTEAKGSARATFS